jgi:hypothetical protein
MEKKRFFYTVVCVILAQAAVGYASLVANYKFDEASGTRAADSAGGYDAALVNMDPGTDWVAGRFGGALDFDGIDDFITLPNYFLRTRTMTVTAWIKLTASQVGYAGLVFRRTGGDDVSGFGFSGTTNEIGYHWDGEKWDWHSGLVVPLGKWVFVAYVMGDTQATLYLGDPDTGSLTSASTTHGGLTETFNTAEIGRDRYEDGGVIQNRYFKGSLDELAIWDEARTTQQITDLFTLGAGPTVEFASAASGGVEAVSPASIDVVLGFPRSGQTYTVQYATSGGTASAGTDYTAVSGTFTFSGGQTVKTIDIPIASDAATEPDETIIVQLSGPTGPSIVLGAAQHTYTILGGPPEVAFSSASSRCPEPGTPAVLDVQLSGASDQTVTVDYAAVGGTAASGSDYAALSGTLTFAPGNTVQAIQIAIADDTSLEADETIVVELSDPVNAMVGGGSVNTATIIDDEPGVVFDGLNWFHSEIADLVMWVNPEGNLEVKPQKRDQIIVQLPQQSLSTVGDVAEFSYLWKTEGRTIGCDCDNHDCSAGCCFDDDIKCVAGTGDWRLGLFDSNGQGYVTADGQYHTNPMFRNYLGYQFRFFPHPSRYAGDFTDSTGEKHKSGSLLDRIPNADDALLMNTDPSWGEFESISGFELEIGAFSPMTLRLERTGGGVNVSMTLNGITYSDTDGGGNQPQKIDVFALLYRHARPYDLLTLAVAEPARSSYPTPVNGAEDVHPDTDLSWRGGSVAVSYDVYLGTGYSEVNGATPSSPQYMGNLAVDAYDPPASLDLVTTYYWRVDDVTATETLKGQVWSFTTARCRLIDDFEAASLNNWQGTGGAVGGIALTSTQKYNGSQSLELLYYNAFQNFYSEAEYTLGAPEDWSGKDALGLYFMGEAGNDPERLYLVVEDSLGGTAEVAYGGNPTAVQGTEWTAWGISISDLSGADLTRVSKVAVGCGDRAGSPPGTLGPIGTIYVDDIGLCLGRCDPQQGPPGDVYGSDCLVNFADHAVKAQGFSDGGAWWQDYAVLADNWLEERLVWP